MPANFFPQHYDKDKLNIDIVVYFKGKRYKRTAGISVPSEHWIKTEQRCSESPSRFPEGKDYNEALKKQFHAVKEAESYFISELLIPTKDQFWNRVDMILHKEDKSQGGFCDYFEKYIESRRGYRKESTLKTLTSKVNILREYEKHTGTILYFKDINSDFYKKFQQYLFKSQHGKSSPKSYSNAYFNNIIKSIKYVFADAAVNGVHSLPQIEFKTEDYIADTIYLSPIELDAILGVKLRHEGEIIARAKFIIGANTGLRISDFNNLHNFQIGDKYITVTTQKTAQKVIVPINSTVRGLLDSVQVFTPLTDQYINRTIKDIAKAAEINTPVEVTKYIAGKRVTEVVEKWQMVTSHTARRSFATNAYKAGVPTLAIMKITGHTTEKSFLRYIKITKEENARLMAEHDFFK